MLVRDYVPCQNIDGEIGMYDKVNSQFYPNAGTGTFTKGNVVEEIGGETIYVAKQFFSGGELSYYGTAPQGLDSNAYGLSAVSLGKFAIFASGRSSSSSDSYLKKVASYDASLTRGTPDELTRSTTNMGAARAEDSALFAGGAVGSSGGSSLREVNGYSLPSLTKFIATSLSVQTRGLEGVSIGNNALFCGGLDSADNYLKSVLAYNSSGTTVTVNGTLTTARSRIAAAAVGDFAILAGGQNSGSDYLNTVDVFNKSLTKETTCPNLATARTRIAATTVGGHALFCGGSNSSSYLTTVEAYDASFTRSTITPLSIGRCDQYQHVAASIEDYALITGGRITGAKFTNSVEVYDASLTRTDGTPMSTVRAHHAAAVAGDYLLIAGGWPPTTVGKTVDVYQIS